MTATIGLMTPHLRSTDFLPPDEHAALLDWTIAGAAGFTPAGLAGNRVDPVVRNALTLRDLGPHRDVLESRVRAAVPGWIAALRVTLLSVRAKSCSRYDRSNSSAASRRAMRSGSSLAAGGGTEGALALAPKLGGTLRCP